MKEFERLKKDGIRKWTVFESGRSLNLSETAKKVQTGRQLNCLNPKWTVISLNKWAEKEQMKMDGLQKCDIIKLEVDGEKIENGRSFQDFGPPIFVCADNSLST